MRINIPLFDRHFGLRKIITIQGIPSSHGTHLPGNRWSSLHPLGGMVLLHAGQIINGGRLHTPAGVRTIGVSDCLWRIGIGNRYCFSVAAVSSSRSRFPAVPVLADSRMSCGVSDSRFCVVQRNSNHNIRPRSDRMDHLCWNSRRILDEAVKAMLLLRAFLIWLIIIGLETVHGILRGLLLVSVLGDFSARQVSVFTGSLLIFSVAYVFIHWLRVESKRVPFRFARSDRRSELRWL